MADHDVLEDPLENKDGSTPQTDGASNVEKFTYVDQIAHELEQELSALLNTSIMDSLNSELERPDARKYHIDRIRYIVTGRSPLDEEQMPLEEDTEFLEYLESLKQVSVNIVGRVLHNLGQIDASHPQFEKAMSIFQKRIEERGSLIFSSMSLAILDLDRPADKFYPAHKDFELFDSIYKAAFYNPYIKFDFLGDHVGKSDAIIYSVKKPDTAPVELTGEFMKDLLEVILMEFYDSNNSGTGYDAESTKMGVKNLINDYFQDDTVAKANFLKLVGANMRRYCDSLIFVQKLVSRGITGDLIGNPLSNIIWFGATQGGNIFDFEA